MRNQKEEFIRQQRQLLTNDSTNYVVQNTKINHIIKNHLNLTNAQLLDTIVSNQKFSNAKFDDKNTLFSSIAIALHDNMPEIADFIFSQNKNQNPNQAHVIEFDASPYFKKIGSGFVAESKRKDSLLEYNQHINAVDTNAITLVIKKDENTPNGFIVISAFPTTNPQTLPNANKIVKTTTPDLTNILEQTDTYKSEYTSPLLKIGLRASCRDSKYDNCRIDYQAQNKYQPKEKLYVTSKVIDALDKPATVMFTRENKDISIEYCKANLKEIKPNTYKTLIREICPRKNLEIFDYDLIVTSDNIHKEIKTMRYVPEKYDMPKKQTIKPQNINNKLQKIEYQYTSEKNFEY